MSIHLRTLRRPLCLALLLSACTPKDGDDTEGTTGDTTTESPTTESPTTADTDTTTTADTDTTTTADTDTTTAADTDAPVAGCDCAEGAPCSVPLCDDVVWNADEQGGTGGDTEGEDPALAAALTCALEALRDGQPGKIRWRKMEGSGQFDEHGAIEMFGDGDARASYGGVVDLCELVSDDIWFAPLQSEAFFTDCLAETEISERFSCLRTATASPSTQCQVGEQDCGI